MRGFPNYAYDLYTNPVSRLYFDVDEADEDLMAGDDAGRPSDEVEFITYTSPGASGQSWLQRGLDADFGRLEGSLVGDTGPWTDLATGLADPSPEGTEKTLWLRYVAHRWAPADDNPRQRFTLVLRSRGQAATDED